MVTKACPKCRLLTEQKNCPQCNSSKLSTKFKGLLIILDEESEVVKEMDIKPGEYALRVK